MIFRKEVSIFKSGVLSRIEQTAKKIELLITSGDDSSSFTLTDRMIEAITKQFKITGTDGTSTVVEGGKIKANSIEIGAVEGLTSSLDSAKSVANTAKDTADSAKSVADNTAQHFWFNSTGDDPGAHIAEKSYDDFIADPINGGPNLRGTSTGIFVRDGLREQAKFGASTYVGEDMVVNMSGGHFAVTRTYGMRDENGDPLGSRLFWIDIEVPYKDFTISSSSLKEETFEGTTRLVMDLPYLDEEYTYNAVLWCYGGTYGVDYKDYTGIASTNKYGEFWLEGLKASDKSSLPSTLYIRVSESDAGGTSNGIMVSLLSQHMFYGDVQIAGLDDAVIALGWDNEDGDYGIIVDDYGGTYDI